MIQVPVLQNITRLDNPLIITITTFEKPVVIGILKISQTSLFLSHYHTTHPSHMVLAPV